VVGVFASSDDDVFCDGDACIITATSQGMQAAQKRLPAQLRKRLNIRKTTFGEICQGLEMGGAYAFDPPAYKVFGTLASRAGLPVAREEFSEPDPRGLHLVRVQLLDATQLAADPQLSLDGWLDDEGLHVAAAGDPPSQAMLDELTRRYQQSIRNSPLWQQMVDEFGEEEAEQMLKDFRAELG
jgi:hypothetical protein